MGETECCICNSTRPSHDDLMYIIIGGTGGIVLLTLFCSCIIFVLLCKILKTQRKIINIQPLKETTQDNKNGAETAPEPEIPPAETKSPKKESPEPNPPEVDPATVEAMYSVVSKEHCEKKRKANLQIQQYDEVMLSMELGAKTQNLGNESVHVESNLQNASVTMEGTAENGGYSRLCHPGPRMSQTKRPEHQSIELLKQDARKGSLSATNTKEGSYSELHPELRPSSQVMVGNYTMIDGKEVAPPPLPSRYDDTSIPLPTQKVPNPSHENILTAPKINPYETIDATPAVTDEEFFDERFMAEFRNTQAGETPRTKGIYDELK